MRELRYDPPLNLAVWDELCELCFKLCQAADSHTLTTAQSLI